MILPLVVSCLLYPFLLLGFIIIPPLAIAPRYIVCSLVIIFSLLTIWRSSITFINHSNKQFSIGYRSVLMLCSLLIGITSAELALMHWTRSNSVGYTLAAQRWHKKFWKPINSAGFREREIDATKLNNKKVIAVIDDSFVAGHGLQNVEDRFSNMLEQLLGAEWIVLNYGKSHTDTQFHLNTLSNLDSRLPLHTVILSYFGNDIADVGRAVGQPPPLPERYTDWFGTRFGVLIEISHLVNFVYWSIPQDDLRDWWQYYIDLYQDPRALRLHEAELNAFVQQAAKKNAKLVVVIFPFLHMLENSTVYTGKIEQIFNAVGVPTLDVSTLVQDLGLKQRIVNTNDVHASKEVNHRIARALHELIDGET